MRKRIAYLGIKGLPSKAGADRVVEAILAKLDKRRYQATVYCSRRAVPKGLILPAIELICLPTLPGKHLNALSLFCLSALHCFWLGNYDLVHLHNVEAAFVLPLLRLRYKVISTSHGAAQARDKWGKVAKTLLRLTEYPYIYLSNLVTSVSKPLATYYEQQYKRPVHYLPNGVEVENAVDDQAAAALLQAHGVTPGNYLLFAAGRIMATKGCHLLLEAFQTLPTAAKLVIIGDASHVPAYRARLLELADERVVMLPFVSEKATLFGLVHAARLFVFPSTVEGMSMMLLEVASLGVPVVASDIPENKAVLPEEALFFQSGNVADLHRQLQWALANHEATRALGRHAQAWVHDQYEWSHIVRQYEQLYARLTAQEPVVVTSEITA